MGVYLLLEWASLVDTGTDRGTICVYKWDSIYVYVYKYINVYIYADIGITENDCDDYHRRLQEGRLARIPDTEREVSVSDYTRAERASTANADAGGHAGEDAAAGTGAVAGMAAVEAVGSVLHDDDGDDDTQSSDTGDSKSEEGSESDSDNADSTDSDDA